MLPDWPLLSAFLAASLVLALTPGPAVFYIVTRTLLQGRSHGLASVAGVALGNLGNALAAAVGLAALFAVSSLAFSIVKYAGAAYLVYLAVQALRGGDGAPSLAPLDTITRQRIFCDGFVVALFNPKTAIFFAAFLPQFMNAHGSLFAQSMTLGGLFVVIAAVTDTLYAFAAGKLAPVLQQAPAVRRAGRYITASAFFGLGLLTAISSHRASK